MALCVASKMIIYVRYKLRTSDVPVMSHINVFFNTKSVYKKLIFYESTLKKKHKSIFHRERECVAT